MFQDKLAVLVLVLEFLCLPVTDNLTINKMVICKFICFKIGLKTRHTNDDKRPNRIKFCYLTFVGSKVGVLLSTSTK